ncbi:MAG: hypothetical protein PHE77_01750 [Candidatus Pacebacteria bacterium]|nr:hypothetical protein [Candidatus Paceibacterota bacterium]
MAEIEKPLLVLDLDGVVLDWGLIFKKDAKIVLLILARIFNVKIVTSRDIFLYITGVAWFWLNNINILIERSGPNGNKATHCKGAFMFVDNDSKHILNVLEEGSVEKVCFFSKDKEVKLETEKKFSVVSNWWDIFWEALSI